MSAAEKPAPQSVLVARCPPQATTTVSDSATNSMASCAAAAAEVNGPSCREAAFVIAPFQIVSTRSAAGRARKLFPGCPGTGLSDEDGSGAGKALRAAKVPLRPA